MKNAFRRSWHCSGRTSTRAANVSTSDGPMFTGNSASPNQGRRSVPFLCIPFSRLIFSTGDERLRTDKGRRFGISLLPAEGQKTSERQYTVVRPSTSCSAQSWCCGPAPCIWVPHISANAGVGAGREQLRSKTGAGASPALQHQNHSGRLCAGHYAGEAGSPGDVLGPIVEGLMDREKPDNEPHCLANAFVLWAYCGLEQIECFELSALKCGGQGRS